MKTIIAFSDIHYCELPEHLVALAQESDYVLFLGDGLSRVAPLLEHRGSYAVKGNCDSLPAPDELVLDIEDMKVFLTHGHLYGVKTDLLNLTLRAEELGCRLVFSGIRTSRKRWNTARLRWSTRVRFPPPPTVPPPTPTRSSRAAEPLQK